MNRSGQFFIITAVLIAGALITITTILTASETIDYNSVLERHDTDIIENVAGGVESEWWDQDWQYRKQLIIEEEAGAFLEDEAVTVWLDARNERVNDTCSDIRVVVDGQAVPWLNTTSCDIDTYDSNTGAVSRWTLDEGSGTTAADVANGGNDGTLNGDTSWVSGRFGSGLLFDGNGDYVETGTSGFDSETFTAMLWARGPGTSQSTTRIINYGDSTANNGGFIIGEDSNGQVRAYVMNESGEWIKFFSGNGVIDDGQWHHLAITYNGSDAKLYVDGTQRNSVTTTYDETPSNPTFAIGREAQGGEEWEGTVDDVRYYNDALPQSEIEGIYRNGMGLNISLDMTPLERKAGIEVYYGNPVANDPAYFPSDLTVSSLSQRPTVIQIGPARAQTEIATKMEEFVDNYGEQISPTLTFERRQGRCDLVTLRSPAAVLDREIC